MATAIAIVLAQAGRLAAATAAIVGWAGIGDNRTKFEFDFATNELWPGNWLWGYMFTAMGVGAFIQLLANFRVFLASNDFLLRVGDVGTSLVRLGFIHCGLHVDFVLPL